jgi:hypothetical protein
MAIFNTFLEHEIKKIYKVREGERGIQRGGERGRQRGERVGEREMGQRQSGSEQEREKTRN